MNGVREGIRFVRHAPLPVAYPRPEVPMLPVAMRTPPAAAVFRPESRFLAPDALYLPSGAAAIHYALRAIGIAAGDEVVVPAYHCPSMLFPVLAAGAVPVIVHVQSDLSVSPGAVEALRTRRTRAVLLPHYFGFLQPCMADMRAWCDTHDIVLIEDCAHAFYDNGFPLGAGSYGHYAICSSRKFFAGGEGGAVVSNVGRLEDRRVRSSLMQEVRGIESLIYERARAGDSAILRRLLRVRDGGIDGPPDREAARREAEPAPATVGDLDAAARGRRALLSARVFVRCTHHARSAAVRRSRYLRWLEVLEHRIDVTPWRAQLPDRMVPYVFPARLQRPEIQFHALKQAGIQLWRWDRLAQSNCAVSVDLACTLIQLPCQQSLSTVEFDRLIAGFEAALDA